MSPNDPTPDPFASTEAYYADYRPGYGERTFEFLEDRFDLDGDSRVLDLGCGAGQVTVPLAARAGRVFGMDPNRAMLAEAVARAERARREIEWVVGSDAELAGIEGPFDLVTMGRSFHWMNQERTLERVHEITIPMAASRCSPTASGSRGARRSGRTRSTRSPPSTSRPARANRPDRVRRPVGRTRRGIRVRGHRDGDVRVGA